MDNDSIRVVCRRTVRKGATSRRRAGRQKSPPFGGRGGKGDGHYSCWSAGETAAAKHNGQNTGVSIHAPHESDTPSVPHPTGKSKAFG